MARMPGAKWLGPPRSFSEGRPAGPPRVIYLHYTAGSESPTAAEDGSAYDRRRTDGTSAHFFTDRDTIAQCIDTMDRSHTALYNANMNGVHIEQCGTLQTRAQWLDAASRPTIANSAKVCAWVMGVHNIPLVRLVDRQVRGGRGIAGHGDATRGFPEDGGTHTDPGAAYPWDVLFADIKHILEGNEITMEDMDRIALPPGNPTNRSDIARIDLWRLAYLDGVETKQDVDKLATAVAGLGTKLTTLATDLATVKEKVGAGAKLELTEADRQDIANKVLAGISLPTSGTWQAEQRPPTT